MIRLVTFLSGLCLLLFAGDATATSGLQVRLLTSNPSPYLGEEILLTLEVERSGTIRDGIVPLWGDLDGLIADPAGPAGVRRSQNRNPEMLVESLQRSVRPIQSGPIELSVRARPTYGLPAVPASLALQIKPLPVIGVPPGYQGAVGTPELQLKQTAADRLELHLRGPYDLAAFPLPTILPENANLNLISDETSGLSPGERHRVLDYRLSPGQAVADIGFSYPVFDPASQSYRLLQTGRQPAPRQQIPQWVGGSILLFILLLGLLLHRRQRNQVDNWIMQQNGEPRRSYLNRLQRAGASKQSCLLLQNDWRERDRQYARHTVEKPVRSTVDLRNRLRREIDKRAAIPHYRQS